LRDYYRKASPAFEAELVEAESYGPNMLPMIDAQILSHLGLAPHDREEETQGEEACDA
jgi:hypothetical protein